MMGSSPQLYIPSCMEIGALALEKKMFEGVLPYVSVASILVDALPPTHGGSTQNFALFGQAVLEKMF